MSTEADSFLVLAQSAYREFEDTADYIWKSITLLDQERTVETEKLSAYFPDADRDSGQASAREWRRAVEFHKLDTHFPHLIATANLFCVTALLETYCLAILRELQCRTANPQPQNRGNAVKRLQEYMSGLGFATTQLANHSPTMVALEIRNCLIHANGILRWSKDEPRLREIQRKQTYLLQEHIDRRKRLGAKELVTIVKSNFGDAIRIHNDYSHLLAAYFRHYVVGLCELARDACRCSKS